MRERLDCAMFSTVCNDAWARSWLGAHAGGHLHVRRPVADIDATLPGSSAVLGQSALLLRRFDVCLIPVSEQNLAWLRTSLQAAQSLLQTPVLALVRNLKAAALEDLYSLGLADFVRDPLCAEELRIRVERLLDVRRYLSVGPEGRASVAHNLRETPPFGSPADARLASRGEEELCSTILERTGLELDAFAVATASRSATSRESFRSAKCKLIERFERAYIHAALGRHSGNIAMAARAAQKHRRAFWALMRKYEIDAGPYRGEEPPAGFPGG